MSWSWTELGTDSDFAEVKSVSVVPDPPELGRNLDIKVTGVIESSPEELEGASVTILVRIAGSTVHKTQKSLPDFLKDLGSSLPSESGPFSLTLSLGQLQGLAPTKYSVRVTGTTTDDHQVFDLDFTFDARPK
ncbi:ML domain-containing protein [Streptomyces erythrochromogenes]|uniref:ML domain-containing protein n=1 Tax=Streptomyces erythrochromogenes TaxID=285574 RepID=UPI0036B6E86F